MVETMRRVALALTACLLLGGCSGSSEEAARGSGSPQAGDSAGSGSATSPSPEPDPATSPVAPSPSPADSPGSEPGSDPTLDAVFLDALVQAKVLGADARDAVRQDAVARAEQWCETLLDPNTTRADVAKTYAKLLRESGSLQESRRATIFYGTAASTYCPDAADKLTQ